MKINTQIINTDFPIDIAIRLAEMKVYNRLYAHCIHDWQPTDIPTYKDTVIKECTICKALIILEN